MQKKTTLLALLCFMACTFAIAQNLQLHFDPRHSVNGDNFPCNYLTATFEMFKADKWGSTYMFVDADFSQKKGNIGLAYAEVMRDQKIGNLPVLAHVEFNGGVVKGGSIPNSYLAGASYPFAAGAFHFNTYVAYKYNAFDRGSHDVQWTGTWGANFCNDKWTVSGFVDVWTENKLRAKDTTGGGKKVILLSEPQFWYNYNSNISLGTEIEISNNFAPSAKKNYASNQFFVNPTLAVKWNF